MAKKRGPPKAAPAIQKMRKTQPCRQSAPPATGDVVPAAFAKAVPLLPLEPPEHLTAEAADCWRVIAAQQQALSAGGLPPAVTAGEAPLVEVVCENYRTWRDACRALAARRRDVQRLAEQQGQKDDVTYLSLFDTDKDGEKVMSVEQAAVEKTGKLVMQGFRTLGLPATMPQMVVQKTHEAADGSKTELTALLGGMLNVR